MPHVLPLAAPPEQWLLLLALLPISFYTYRQVAGWQFAAMVLAAALIAFSIMENAAGAATLALVGVVRWAQVRRGAEPHSPSRRDALEFGIVIAGLLAYSLARRAIESSFAPAHDNALEVIEAEREAGLYFEPGLQAAFLGQDWLLRALNGFYVHWYHPIVAATLVWLFITDAPRYRVFRNALGISVVFAVILIAAFPVAPPRLVPSSELIDTIASMGEPATFANDYAAVPSLHVGWLALGGLLVALQFRHRVAMFAFVPAIAMAFTVMVTGNHYWLDWVIGVLISVGPALVLLRASRRPQPRQAPAPASRRPEPARR